MSRNLYIADLHLGHQNCIGFDGRPFSSIDEHDKALVTNWNAVVMPDDHVYVVGDFAYHIGMRSRSLTTQAGFTVISILYAETMTSGRRNMKAVSRALMIFSRSVICCTAVQWK